MVNHPARILALVICLGVLIGGSLPELGNLAVYYVFHDKIDAHTFNGFFLAFGIGGIFGCGIPLYRRLAYVNSSSSRVGKIVKKSNR